MDQDNSLTKFSFFKENNTKIKVSIYVNENKFLENLQLAFAELHNHFDQVSITLKVESPPAHVNKSEVHIILGNDYLDTPTLIVSNKKQHKNIPHIGYQRHLIDPRTMPDEVKILWCSLGDLRLKGHLVEPFLRSCTTVSFYADAIRGADCGWVKGCQPSGLTSEEACQIFQGLGTANNIQTIFMQIPDQADDIIAALYAEMIWYFIEGRQHFVQDHPLVQSYQEYMVSLEDIDAIFVQNELSGRWWLCTDVDNKLIYIPCSELEYKEAAQGFLCDRLRYFANLA